MNEHPLKILHLASHESLQRGGAVQMLRLATGLAQRGHAVTAAFNASNEDLPKTDAIACAEQAGVSLIGIKLDAPDGPGRLRALWREGGFDVIHCHREQALVTACRALAGEQVPCLIAQRGTVYLPGWFSEEHRLLLSRRVDRIVAVAHAVKRALVWRRFVRPGKIEVIYGGVDLERFHPGVDGRMMRLRLGAVPGTAVVTAVGALIEKKGMSYFIEAAARVRQRRQGVQFWIAGGGKLEAKLCAQAEALDLGPMIQFLGHVDELPEVLAASDLVVCASVKGEGLTGTLREALAMERPVVTTDVAGNTELVEEGRTGFVAKAADPASLADAIGRALADPDRTRDLARAGRERTVAWCAEPVRSEKVEALYRRILDNKSR